MTNLTVEQQNEIDTAWYALAREQLNPLFGERIDGQTRANMTFIARNIGIELSHQFYRYLASDERIEVTVDVDDNFTLVAGWRAVKGVNTAPLITGFTDLRKVGE